MMRALVKFDKGDGQVELADVPLPKLGDDEVLVEVRAAGICGSDIHIYHGTYETDTPLILGHEYAGAIVEIGPLVSGWRVGDRVVMENNPFACGECAACRHGSPNVCPNKRAIGFGSDGCFAQFVKAQAGLLHRVPDGLSYEIAALAEPMAVSAHAVVDRGSIQKGNALTVFGPGSIGTMCCLVAKHMGASKVVLVGIGRDEMRLATAEELGIQTINCEAVDAWRSAVDGSDLCIEASGNPNAVRECYDLVRRSGRIVPIGITGRQNVPVPWDLALRKEITVSFSYSSKSADWEMGLSLLSSGEINARKLISAVLPMDNWKDAFCLAEEARSGKILLIP